MGWGMMLGSAVGNVIDWFTGDGGYMRLTHCMNHDTLWIAITVALDLLVATGYGLIALHWWKNGRHLPPTPARRALAGMRNIFLFCGICGYAFIPIKMVWPAWRLYDIVMAALAWVTWRYALRARDLKVIYNEVGRSGQLEKDLEESREDARRKSYFLNAVSHDLRTPLNGVLLQANLVEIGAQTGDRELLAESLAQIKSCAAASAELLNNFLEYARVDWAMEKNALATVDLAAVLQGIVRLSMPAAEQKGLYLRAQAPTHLAMRTDRVKLERILNNLVSNAVKFTEQGGVRIEVERAGSGVEIHVIDTGIGIAPEAQERLFDEFYQLHNRERDHRKGFGLGLSIARRLARHLGGDVTVDSAPGRGSRFSVVLPTEADDDSAVIRGGAERGAQRAGPDPTADDSSGATTAPLRRRATELEKG